MSEIDIDNKIQKKTCSIHRVQQFSNPTVRHHLLEQYNRESINVDDRFDNVTLSKVGWDDIIGFEYTENELNPFRGNDIPLKGTDAFHLTRPPSVRDFSKEKIPFSQIEDLVIQSFGADPNTGRRPYASGGGLYPVDALIAINSKRIADKDIASGVYHFRPFDKVLQPIVHLSEEQMFDGFFLKMIEEEHQPHFVIIYVMHVSKSIFKYQYRGYRNSMMEAGLMAHQATHVAEKLGLATCPWASFNEHQVRHLLRLDPCEHLPILLQLMGTPKSD